MRLNDATPGMWDKATQKYGKVAEKTGLEPWATMAEEGKSSRENRIRALGYYGRGRSSRRCSQQP